MRYLWELRQIEPPPERPKRDHMTAAIQCLGEQRGTIYDLLQCRCSTYIDTHTHTQHNVVMNRSRWLMNNLEDESQGSRTPLNSSRSQPAGNQATWCTEDVTCTDQSATVVHAHLTCHACTTLWALYSAPTVPFPKVQEVEKQSEARGGRGRLKL